jgi:hypothetical protein
MAAPGMLALCEDISDTVIYATGRCGKKGPRFGTVSREGGAGSIVMVSEPRRRRGGSDGWMDDD